MTKNWITRVSRSISTWSHLRSHFPSGSRRHTAQTHLSVTAASPRTSQPEWWIPSRWLILDPTASPVRVPSLQASAARSPASASPDPSKSVVYAVSVALPVANLGDAEGESAEATRRGRAVLVLEAAVLALARCGGWCLGWWRRGVGGGVSTAYC